MKEMRGRILWAVTLLGMIAAGPAARAQDDEGQADEAQVVVQPAFMLSEQQFDLWVFGNVTTSDAGHERLESLLKLQIDDVERTCGISPIQRKKLQLAGRGDIKRFFDLVEEKRKKFQLVRADRNKIGEIFQDIQPLQRTYQAGVLGDDSIFAKTLKKTLNDEQTGKYEQTVRERKLFRYRAKVELVVAMLDNSMGFTDDQRRRFTSLMLEETQPPDHFGQNDYYFVLYQAAKLPETKVKPIFDDAQWRLLSRQFEQARAMEPFLKANGFIAGGGAIMIEVAPAPPAPVIRRVQELKKQELKKDK